MENYKPNFSSTFDNQITISLRRLSPEYSQKRSKRALSSSCCATCQSREFFLCCCTNGKDLIYLVRDNRPRCVYIFNPTSKSYTFDIPSNSLMMKRFSGTIVWNVCYLENKLLCFGVGFDESESDIFIGEYNFKKWKVLEDGRNCVTKKYFEANREGLGKISILGNNTILKYGGYTIRNESGKTSSVISREKHCSCLHFMNKRTNEWNKIDGVSILKCFTLIVLNDTSVFVVGEQWFKKRDRIKTQIWKLSDDATTSIISSNHQIDELGTTSQWKKIFEFPTRVIDYKKKTFGFSYLKNHIGWINGPNLTIVKISSNRVGSVRRYRLNVPFTHSVQCLLRNKLYFFVGRAVGSVSSGDDFEEEEEFFNSSFLEHSVFELDLRDLFVNEFVPVWESRARFVDIVVRTHL